MWCSGGREGSTYESGAAEGGGGTGTWGHGLLLVRGRGCLGWPSYGQ